jgi:hypothetical protein
MATEIKEQIRATDPMDQPEKERTLDVVGGGTGIEAIAGIGTVVLAILGLAGILPLYMMAIATIVVGAGLLVGGGAGASRVHYLRSHAVSNMGFAELTGGLSTEFVGGFAGVVLGILALIGIAPAVLLPVAVIVFGGSLLIGAGATSRINRFPAFGDEYSHADAWSREATSAAVGGQVLIGLATVTLGILALVGLNWMTLTLVALLGVGASTFFTGAALTSRLQTALHHERHHW